jgi:hypothetical protein
VGRIHSILPGRVLTRPNYNIFENINDLLINKYLDEGNKDINKFIPTFINNQYGKN